ncbi:hypothetical protein H4R21_005322, partial [Coemansia helicoidea]
RRGRVAARGRRQCAGAGHVRHSAWPHAHPRRHSHPAAGRAFGRGRWRRAPCGRARTPPGQCGATVGSRGGMWPGHRAQRRPRRVPGRGGGRPAPRGARSAAWARRRPGRACPGTACQRRHRHCAAGIPL